MLSNTWKFHGHVDWNTCTVPWDSATICLTVCCERYWVSWRFMFEKCMFERFALSVLKSHCLLLKNLVAHCYKINRSFTKTSLLSIFSVSIIISMSQSLLIVRKCLFEIPVLRVIRIYICFFLFWKTFTHFTFFLFWF